MICSHIEDLHRRRRSRAEFGLVYTVTNLLPEDCKSVMQSVYKVSEPTAREQSAWVKPLYMFSEPTSR